VFLVILDNFVVGDYVFGLCVCLRTGDQIRRTWHPSITVRTRPNCTFRLPTSCWCCSMVQTLGQSQMPVTASGSMPWTSGVRGCVTMCLCVAAVFVYVHTLCYVCVLLPFLNVQENASPTEHKQPTCVKINNKHPRCSTSRWICEVKVLQRLPLTTTASKSQKHAETY